MAEQAANVLLPTGGAGGLALGAWALRRIGMPAERIGRRTVAFFLITSSVNFAAVIFAGLGLGLGLLPGQVAFLAAVVPALLAAAFLAAIALSPRVLEGGEAANAGRIRAALAKGRGYLADGVRDAIALLGSGRPLIVLGAIGYMALDVLALAAVFAALRRRRADARRLRPRLRGRPARRPGPAARRRRRHRRRPDPRLRPPRHAGRGRRRRGARLPRLPARRPRDPRDRRLRLAAAQPRDAPEPDDARRRGARRLPRARAGLDCTA